MVFQDYCAMMMLDELQQNETEQSRTNTYN